VSKLLDMVRAPQAITAGPRFRLCACQRCGGDAFLDAADGGEWRCLQCSRTVPVPGSANQQREPARAMASIAGHRA